MAYSANKKTDRIERILYMYTELLRGESIRTVEMEGKFGVDTRTIRRDIANLKGFLSEYAVQRGYRGEVYYDPKFRVYSYHENEQQLLSKEEVLAVCKILLDSRAFRKKDMKSIIDRLIENGVPKDKRAFIKAIIGNEAKHYIELQHKKDCMRNIWKIGMAIFNHTYIEIIYKRPDRKESVTRRLKPLSIMFNEFYFYMAAFQDDKELIEKYELEDALPTIYRIDRIKRITIRDEKYNVRGMKNFEEGEFRKRMQFMYGGPLLRIRFLFKGPNPEPILDRLPTARLLGGRAGKPYLIEAEVYGDGFKRWFMSQGNLIEIISEENLSRNLKGNDNLIFLKKQ